MRKLIRVAVVTAALFLVFPVAIVQATPSTSVRFDVEVTIAEGQQSHGPFVASGPAVETGLMCPAGNMVDVAVMAVGWSPTGVNFLVLKEFTCTDGSGTFLVRVEARADGLHDFHWQVMGGTDAYARLRGTGTGHSESTSYGVFDQYAGGLHLD